MNRDAIKDNVFNAMNFLIESSREIQKHLINENKKYIEDNDRKLAFLKEFCTIKICSSRQSGHSTAIIKTAVEKFDSSVIITRTDYNTIKIKEQIKKDYPDISVSKFDKIICADINSRYLCSLPKIDAIFVDMATFLSFSKLHNIYSIAMSSAIEFPFFIILAQ